MRKNEIKILIYFFIILLCIITVCSIRIDPKHSCGIYSTTDFWINVLVESHGIIIEILIVGLLLQGILLNIEKRKEINDLKKKIDFNRELKTIESKHLLASIIKLLNDLQQTDMHLQKCDLSDLLLARINLTKSSLHATDFTHTNLRLSNFKQSKGERTIFDNATLTGANFINSNFKRLKMRNIKGHNIDLSQCQLLRCGFNESDMESADLRSSTITQSSFDSSTLKSADFRFCIIEEVSFDNSDLKNINFSMCEFKKNNTFENANLENANFLGAINVPVNNLALALSLRNAKFSDDDRLVLVDLGVDFN